MILVLNNMNSFQQHLEDMKNFRQNHKSRPAEQINDMPRLFDVRLPQETGLIKALAMTAAESSSSPSGK
jgi:hypothetical protein